MIKIKILGDYGWGSNIRDDSWTADDNGKPVLVKGEYTLVDEIGLALIGKTKKFDIVSGVIVDMTLQEIADFESKRNAAKAATEKQAQIAALKQQLAPLQEDLVQVVAGQYIPNIEYKRAEFRRIHNEIRALEGKPPRAVQNV